MVDNNPGEIGASYLLGKIEFSQKNYREALVNFYRVINPPGEARLRNELLLKSMMYISACLNLLEQREHLESFVRLVEESASREQLVRMLKEEGLEKEWARIKKSLR